jgi:aldehyde dehydrogenase (NAD+)
VIQGEGGEVVPEMISSFRFDHIFYTGSPGVGRIIYRLAAADLVPVTLELGGKSPAVVEADADLRVSARRIAVGKFSNTGQTCVAPDYVLVHKKVKKAFVSAMQECLLGFFGGDPAVSEAYGKIISEKRFDKLVSYLSQGRILAGGMHDRSKLYISPTLMDEIPPEAPLMQEEIFGPLLPLVTYESREEALALIRRNPDPLGFYIFSRNLRNAEEWIRSFSFGGGCINNADWQFTNHHLPFGGVGSSGLGAYHGKYSFNTFTHAKSVMQTPLWFDPDLKYPPFRGKMRWFKLFVR